MRFGELCVEGDASWLIRDSIENPLRGLLFERGEGVREGWSWGEGVSALTALVVLDIVEDWLGVGVS